MRTLRSQHTYVPLAKHQETPVGKSVTVPDEALTIQEILTRSMQGLPTGNAQPGTYNLDINSDNFDDHDVEKLQLLDPYDRELLARDLAAKNEQHKKYLEDHLKEKQSLQEIENQKLEDARIEAFLKKAEEKSKPQQKAAKGGTTASND